MRKFNYLWALLMGSMFTFASCSDNDDPANGLGGSDVPEAVMKAFTQKYPNAQNVEWTKTDAYAIAKFYDTPSRGGDQNHVAWFDLAGAQWGMTEMEIPFAQLPAAVLDGFKATPYFNNGWEVDDEVDVLQRPDAEMLYVIEVEKEDASGEIDVDLYFTPDGLLVKEIIDDEQDKDYHEFLPETPQNAITAWVGEHFPDAKIIDIDVENNGTEVEIVAGGVKREVMFDASNAWLYTKTEYSRFFELPAPVLATLKTVPHYTGNNIDDIDLYETAQGESYYMIELETRRDDVKVYIGTDGTLLEGRPVVDEGGQGVPVGDDVHKFIADKYPNAVVLEKDYDNGYLEVEIRHDGIEKEVVFNGRNEWMYTEWEIRNLPEALAKALEAEGYNLQTLDEDIEVVQNAKGLTYKVEISKNNQEYEVVLDEAGKILSATLDD